MRGRLGIQTAAQGGPGVFGGHAWTGVHKTWLRRKRFDDVHTTEAFNHDFDAVLNATVARDDRRHHKSNPGPRPLSTGRIRVPVSLQGYRSLRRFAQRLGNPDRATEGAAGLGALLTQRLGSDGVEVIDVPAKLQLIRDAGATRDSSAANSNPAR